ncbi:MAG: hypothetical protein BAJATHORv1_50066 [Candidatus Thorarchaeota archaeon]|nr:MAG: hypothetical protein BAJATHORv1_50066 [Candidatus Thorarchaeota archaeon]
MPLDDYKDVEWFWSESDEPKNTVKIRFLDCGVITLSMKAQPENPEIAKTFVRLYKLLEM